MVYRELGELGDTVATNSRDASTQKGDLMVGGMCRPSEAASGPSSTDESDGGLCVDVKSSEGHAGASEDDQAAVQYT